MPQPVRLQKFLSQAGIASRRAAEELIRSGRVRVNGETVAELGTKVDPSRDAVEVDGRMVRAAAPVWIAVYKPRGVVSTRSDPEGRRTLYDVLPPRFRRLFYVGRLDRISEGLMLLTNDGDAAHRLLHPRYGVSREYEVSLAGRLTKAERDRLLDGVTLEDGLARAESIRASGRSQTGASRVRIVLREGRKREVRRMFEAVGHRVRRLVRVRYGPVELGELEPGAWRELTDAEIARVKKLKVES
jgi:23S rRNA pseudouridine2605 synthase